MVHLWCKFAPVLEFKPGFIKSPILARGLISYFDFLPYRPWEKPSKQKWTKNVESHIASEKSTALSRGTSSYCFSKSCVCVCGVWGHALLRKRAELIGVKRKKLRALAFRV
jgi:hypothetical protein